MRLCVHASTFCILFVVGGQIVVLGRMEEIETTLEAIGIIKALPRSGTGRW
jgi:hypothetical protein